jgi:hypothetical protein
VKIEHFLNSILQLGCGKGIDAGFNEGCAGGNLAWKDPSYLVEQATQYRENIFWDIAVIQGSASFTDWVACRFCLD